MKLFKLQIDKSKLLEITNLKFGVFYPIKDFISNKDFKSIIEDYHLYNNAFFPIPILFSIFKKDYEKIKKIDQLKIFFFNNFVCNLNIKSIYKINKSKYFYKIFRTKNYSHPGLHNFVNSGNYYIDGKIGNFNHDILKKINFFKPSEIKKKIKRNNLKTIAGFHTRNAPHRAHEWIHQFGLKNCEGLLIQPLIGQFRSTEYNEKIIIKTNKYLIDNFYSKQKVFFSVLNTYPRYAGPREALLHAIIRRNFGCTHFLVGGDHAGVGKFYKKYESQKICLNYEKQLNIKILAFKEPYLCNHCKNIINSKCLSCKNKKVSKTNIRGQYLRSFIAKNKKIPEEFMRKEISSLLSKNSIIR